MLFYKVTGIMEANEAPEEDRRVRRENQRKIEMKRQVIVLLPVNKEREKAGRKYERRQASRTSQA